MSYLSHTPLFINDINGGEIIGEILFKKKKKKRLS